MRIALIMPGRLETPGKMHKKSKGLLPASPLLEVAGATGPEHEVILVDELVKGSLTEKTLPQADLYALSYLTTSRKGAFARAKMIRDLTGKPVIAGGMDVTGYFLEGGHDQELLEQYDAIFVGRLTRSSWQQLLKDCECGRLNRVYRAAMNEPWEFFLPRYDLIDPKDYLFPAALRSSAGCTEACPFCTVHLIIGSRRKVILKSLPLLEQELALLPASRYFADYSDSFGADWPHTQNVLSLYRASRRPWFTELTIRNLLGITQEGGEPRPSLIEPMAESGAAGVYIGVESIFGPVSAKSTELAVAEEAIERIHDAGMIAVISIIMDITGKEGKDTFQRTVDWILANKVDFVQYSLLALLPGSNLRHICRQKGEIIDNNPEHYDGSFPTRSHPNLSPQEQIEGLQYCYTRTYSLPNIGRRLPMTPKGRRVIVAAANAHVYYTTKGWVKKGTYQHWLKTRENFR